MQGGTQGWPRHLTLLPWRGDLDQSWGSAGPEWAGEGRAGLGSPRSKSGSVGESRGTPKLHLGLEGRGERKRPEGIMCPASSPPPFFF